MLQGSFFLGFGPEAEGKRCWAFRPAPAEYEDEGFESGFRSYGFTILITHIRGLVTPLITTHEPPSRVLGFSLAALETTGVSSEILGPNRDP